MNKSLAIANRLGIVIADERGPVTRATENKMNLKVTLNGFHGYQTHSVRGTMRPETENDEFQAEGYRIEITPSGAAKFGCKMSDCTCGEGLAETFWVPKAQVSGNEIAVNGNYPQR